MIKKKNTGASFFEILVLAIVCIVVLVPPYILLVEESNQDTIESKSGGYTCIYGGSGSSGSYSRIALYYNESDNYVYCKLYISHDQLLSYPLYTEDGNKIKYINGVLIEDNTGKEVRIND